MWLYLKVYTLTDAMQLQNVSADGKKAESQAQEAKIEEIDQKEQQVLPEEDNSKVAEN